jgi:tetratricopeptide (TPR) repeat protein
VVNGSAKPISQIVSIFSVTYARNPFFSGRDAFLGVLTQELAAQKPRQYNHRIALYGLGGVGKTQVALEYAYRHQSDYMYVFWVSAVDQTQILSGFANIARLTGCASSLTGAEGVAKAVLRWLRDTEDWLLILDNLDDITVANGYLPDANGAGHTLITTRNKNSDGIPANGLEVREMDSANAIQFLLDRVGIVEPTEEIRKEGREIVKELGYLPLAIDQAAAYIRTSQNIFEYRKIYEKQRMDVLRYRPPGNYDYTHTVATTWRISLDRLKTEFPGAVDLIRLFAFMNPDEVLVDFIRGGIDALPPNLQNLILNRLFWIETLRVLESFSLIRVFAAGEKISIHRLVQAVIQDDLNQATRDQVSMDVLGLALRNFPAITNAVLGNLNLRETCRRFGSQVTFCLENTLGVRETNKWLTLAHRLTSVLHDDGFYLDAYHWRKRTHEIERKVLGNEHPDVKRMKCDLAADLTGLGRLHEAFELSLESFNECKNIYGSVHLVTMRCMEVLSEAYANLGHFQQSVSLQEEVLRLWQKLGSGVETSEILWVMRRLADGLGALGRWAEAERLARYVLNAYRRVSGQEHPETLDAMGLAGTVFFRLGMNEEAEYLLTNALRLSLKVQGREHLQTLGFMSRLADYYREVLDIKKSLDISEDAWNIAKTALGPEHNVALEIRWSLARCYYAHGDTERSMKLHEEVWELQKARIGVEHPNTLLSAGDLGAIWIEVGEVEKGTRLLQQTLDSQVRTLGADHDSSLWTKATLESIRAVRMETQHVS